MIRDPVKIIALTLCGVCAGSFCTNFALRGARGEQALQGRSHCDQCLAPLGFFDSLPIISYLRCGGVCGVCGGRIDLAHPLGELAGAVIVLSALWAHSALRAALMVVLGLVLLESAVIDLKIRQLPDAATGLAAIVAFLLALSESTARLVEGLIAAVVTFAVLEFLRRWFQRARGSAGLGFGDVKLAAALALWLAAATSWALALASLMGLAYFVIARPADKKIAFGPWIVVAAWIVGASKEAGIWSTFA